MPISYAIYSVVWHVTYDSLASNCLKQSKEEIEMSVQALATISDNKLTMMKMMKHSKVKIRISFSKYNLTKLQMNCELTLPIWFLYLFSKLVLVC